MVRQGRYYVTRNVSPSPKHCRTRPSRRRRQTSPDPRRPTIDRIVETAIYLQTESRRLAREQCAKHGITATQLNVLKLLQTVGDLSLSELVEADGATNSTVTGIVDRMVAAGLVAREQSTEDRRVWMIRLTPDGRAMARKVEVAPWEILHDGGDGAAARRARAADHDAAQGRRSRRARRSVEERSRRR